MKAALDYVTLERQDLGHPLPHRDPWGHLQQGRLQGGGARSRKAAEDLGRADRAPPRRSPKSGTLRLRHHRRRRGRQHHLPLAALHLDERRRDHLAGHDQGGGQLAGGGRRRWSSTRASTSRASRRTRRWRTTASALRRLFIAGTVAAYQSGQFDFRLDPEGEPQHQLGGDDDPRAGRQADRGRSRRLELHRPKGAKNPAEAKKFVAVPQHDREQGLLHRHLPGPAPPR